jgi:hypothetical protein
VTNEPTSMDFSRERLLEAVANIPDAVFESKIEVLTVSMRRSGEIVIVYDPPLEVTADD